MESPIWVVIDDLVINFNVTQALVTHGFIMGEVVDELIVEEVE